LGKFTKSFYASVQIALPPFLFFFLIRTIDSDKFGYFWLFNPAGNQSANFQLNKASPNLRDIKLLTVFYTFLQPGVVIAVFRLKPENQIFTATNKTRSPHYVAKRSGQWNHSWDECQLNANNSDHDAKYVHCLYEALENNPLNISKEACLMGIKRQR
jgi:hypothetical protein